MATLSIHSHEKTTALIKVAVTPPPPPEKSVAAAALPSNSLYVGDLDPSVDEAQLSHLFNQAAKVVSVRVCKDKKTPSSLGYAYVNFSNQQDGNSHNYLLSSNFISNHIISLFIISCLFFIALRFFQLCKFELRMELK